MNRAYHTVENLKLFYVFLLCLYYGSLISCHVMSVVQFTKHHVIMLIFLPTTDNLMLRYKQYEYEWMMMIMMMQFFFIKFT